MRKMLLLALTILLSFVLVVPSNAQVLATKKGASTNNVPGASQALTAVNASWFYSWNTNPEGVAKPSGVEFVPMIWGRNSVNSTALNNAKANGSTLLGFNEPDMGGQANMSVDEALNLWPQLQSTGMRLGAPAVAFGGADPGGWLDRFMSGAAARGLRVDFIPLHWYGSDFSSNATGQLESYVNAVRARYNKPVWITEYALVDWSTGTARYPNSAQQVDFINRSTAMLAGKSFVERYAWFTLNTQVFPTGLCNGATPNASGNAYRNAPA